MDEARGEALVAFVREYLETHGYPPSTREITAALDVSSTRTVHDLLVNLRAVGKVDWIEGHARTLRIVDESRDKW